MNAETFLNPYEVVAHDMISVCCECFPGRKIFEIFPDLSEYKLSHGMCHRHARAMAKAYGFEETAFLPDTDNQHEGTKMKTATAKPSLTKLEGALKEYELAHTVYMNTSKFEPEADRVKHRLDNAREAYVLAREEVFPNQLVIGGGW